METMETQGNAESKYHVLLVGIDDYPTKPLAGCVNDIDAIQRLLLGPRMNVPEIRITPDRIIRLAAPCPGTTHDTTIESLPPTLENLRGALTALGSDEVGPNDHVFIYYSGHGSRIELKNDVGQRFHREVLVPVDFAEPAPTPRVLYDYELNALLQKITARTGRVTVVLDCCHAAGVSRGNLLPRSLDLRDALGLWDPLPDPARIPGTRGAPPRGQVIAGRLGDCQVVASCLGHQLAMEGADRQRVHHGLLTRALVAAIEAARDRPLDTITWASIWQAIRADLADANPSQHAWMSGNAGRRVIAGSPVHGDPGFPVVHDGDGFRIDAGTLAGVTRGARLAIYGEAPSDFAALESPADLDARWGLVRVSSATRATATAAFEGPAFTLPPGARGRIVALGEQARITYAIEPANAAIDDMIAASALFQRAAPGQSPEVQLTQDGDRWLLTDTLHGTDEHRPVLCAVTTSELANVRALFEHYYAYSQPLRLAAATGDLPGQLVLRVLSCDRELGASEAQTVSLPEAPTSSRGTYELTSGDRVCFEVQNTSGYRLRVTLANAAASGKVQMLGDQTIDAGTHYVFWADSALGKPFAMKAPDGVDWFLDRLVAIGRSKESHELDHLRVDRTFADVLRPIRGARVTRDFDDGVAKSSEADHWTAAQADITTRRRQPPSTDVRSRPAPGRGYSS
jgi:hypothetical protein